MLSKILFVDDEDEVLVMAQRKLERSGYGVVLARNGQEAFAIAQHEPIDLIVSDVVMPYADGWRLCNQLRGSSATAHIPIIIATAFPDRENIFKKIGINHFLFKPFDGDAMLDEIRLVLNSADVSLREYKILIQAEGQDLGQQITTASSAYGLSVDLQIVESDKDLCSLAEQTAYDVVLINISQNKNATLNMIRKISSLPRSRRPVVLIYSGPCLPHEIGEEVQPLSQFFVKDCLSSGASYFIDRLTPFTFFLMLSECC